MSESSNQYIYLCLNYMLLWLPAVDITVFHNGFHGDLNETFFVGEVDEEAKKLVQTTYECLMQAIDSGTGPRAVTFTCTPSMHQFCAAKRRLLSAPQ